MNSPVILITGAGKGIGKAITLAIIGQASSVYAPKLMLTSRTKSDLQELQSLAQKSNLICEILPLDISTHPALVVEEAVQKFGRIDQVIHSAGVGRFGNFIELTAEDLEFTMKTNVEASFLFMQAAYSQLKKQSIRPESLLPSHKGDLVWITSVAAEKPFEQSAIYCMSKYAQRGLVEVMRISARKDGIRIIDIKPGATLTPMWGEVDQALENKMMKAEDIAQITINALSVHPRASVEDILIRPIAGDI